MSQTKELTVSPRHKLRNLTLLCASSLTVMAGTPVAPALPTMAEAFADQPSAEILVGLMLTMPGLFIALLALGSGWLVDRIGRKPLLIWGTLLYAAAGTSGLYLDSLWMIVAGRAVLGIAVSAIMTSAVTLIGDYFTAAARHRFMGIQAAFMSAGGMVFLMAGGMLADVSWRGPFLVYFASLALLPMVLVSISEPRHDDRLVNDAAVDPTEGAPVATIGLIYVLAFFGMIGFYAIPVQIPYHLQALTGSTGTYTGLAIACMTLFATVSAILYSRVKARLSFQAIIAIMLLGIGTGYLIVAMAGGYVVILLGMMVAGLGLGLLMPNLNVWLMSVAPVAIRGRLVGGLTMSLFLGQFISPVMLAPLYNAWGTVGVFNTLGVVMLTTMLIFAVYAIYRARPRRGKAGRSRV